MAEAVLEFTLEVIGEAIAESGVDAPDVVAPSCAFILVADCAEELLVPTQCAEELWSDFVFCLEVVGERIGVADAGYLESCFVKLCPQLEVMPREGKILRQDQFAIVANAATGRKRRCSDWEEIRTGTGREAE